MDKQQTNPSNLAKLIEKMGPDATPGKAPQWNFDPDACGTFDFRIARDGAWYYKGSKIDRKNMCKLFSSVLRKSDDGRFFLVTPAEQGQIIVEDAPFVAVELTEEGTGRDQRLTFRTNLDHTVTADEDHPIRVDVDPGSGEPAPYVLVRDGLEALILRPQFYQLVELAEEVVDGDRTILRVWSGGAAFDLGAA